MSNTLRNLLLGATVGLSMPGAMAQSETFTGLSGNSYYVDYASGLVMQLHENDAIIVSPAEVADKEFRPMAAKLEALARDHMSTEEGLVIANDKFQNALKMLDLEDYEYDLLITNFRNASLNVLQQYYQLAEILEKALELQAASKPARTYGEAKTISTTFTFDIRETLTELAHAGTMAEGARSFLNFFENDLDNFVKDLEESQDELDEIASDFDFIIEGHTAYILGISELLAESLEFMSEETLLYIAEQIQDKVEDLNFELENLPTNPADYPKTWMDICLNSMQYAYDFTVDTDNLLLKLSEEISTLFYNFSGVLFAGPLGDEAGLFYTILNDNGSLILPPFVYSDDNQYNVTGVDGNIFSGMPEGVSISDLKLFLPATISSISSEAFAIDGIKQVTVYSNAVPSLTNDSFTETTYANAQLYVRDELLDAFKDDAAWSKFQNILPESMTEVVAVPEMKPAVVLEGSTLKVDAPEGTMVGVYTTDGKTIYNGNPGYIGLPANGLYIVKAGSHTMKIRY